MQDTMPGAAIEKPLSRIFKLWSVLPLLVLLLAIAPQRATAGQITVLSGVAKSTVGTICSIDDIIVSGPTVTSDQLACNTITASNVEVGELFAGRGCRPAQLAFTAGGSIQLGPTFSVCSGVNFSAVIDPSVANPFAFVTDGSPNTEATYNARFDLRMDGLNLVTGEDIGHFNGYSADGTLQFKVMLRNFASQNGIALFARDNNLGSLVEYSSGFLLGPNFYAIQIMWEAASGTGKFQVSIGDAPFAGLTTLNNATSRIDFVRWGLIDGNLISTTGFIEIDNFLSWN